VAGMTVAISHRDELDAQRRIVPHAWKDTAMSFLTSRLVRRLRPGIAATLAVEESWRRYWDESNERARSADGPLWVALGDSTAQGIGAPAWDRGYVGQLLALLQAHDGRSWRVVNASRTGARLRDVVTDQLRYLDALPSPPDLVTCAAGANDVAWRPGGQRALRALTAVLVRLPPGSVIATLPKGLGERRTSVLNAVIRAEAPTRGLLVADVWAYSGPPWSGRLAPDGFHPSEHGYERWAAAFAEALGLTKTGPGACGGPA